MEEVVDTISWNERVSVNIYLWPAAGRQHATRGQFLAGQLASLLLLLPLSRVEKKWFEIVINFRSFAPSSPQVLLHYTSIQQGKFEMAPKTYVEINRAYTKTSAKDIRNQMPFLHQPPSTLLLDKNLGLVSTHRRRYKFQIDKYPQSLVMGQTHQ